jgi:hypothetical protein
MTESHIKIEVVLEEDKIYKRKIGTRKVLIQICWKESQLKSEMKQIHS